MRLVHRFLKRLRATGVVAFAVLPAIVAVTAGEDAWSQSARTIKIIVPLAPGGGSDILARRDGGPDQPRATADHRGREPGRRGLRDRDRSRIACRARRQYVAHQHAESDYRAARAEVQLRCAEELRADLPSREFARADRRQQRIAVSRARRSARRGARQSRRVDAGERRARQPHCTSPSRSCGAWPTST